MNKLVLCFLKDNSGATAIKYFGRDHLGPCRTPAPL
jgi:Flp pilus assembly pilin Flp